MSAIARRMLDLRASMSAAFKPVIVEAEPNRPKTLERAAPAAEVTPAEANAIAKDELLRQHIVATNERICEVVESIALEIGDDRLLAKVEENLKLRGLKPMPKRMRPKKPRRYTTFLDLETGVALNAKAKAEGKNRYWLIAEIVREHLGLAPLPPKSDG